MNSLSIIVRLSTIILVGLFYLTGNTYGDNAPVDVTSEVSKHLIVVDSEGRPRNPIVYQADKGDPAHGVDPSYDITLPYFVANSSATSGDSKSAYKTLRQENVLYHSYIAAMEKNISDSHKTKILIVIHGGMNFIKGAVARACASYKTVQDSSDYYPIYICWDSNPFSTYWDGLVFNREGEYHRQWPEVLYGIFTTPLAFAGDLGGAGARSPEIFCNQTYGDLQTVMPSQFPEPQRANCRIPYMDDKNQNGVCASIGGSVNGGSVPMQSSKAKAGIAASVDQRKKAPYENAERGIDYVATLPAKIVTATALDAIGNRAWNQMSARVQMMFRSDAEYNFDDTKGAESAANHPEWEYNGGYAPPRGAVGVFIRSLSRWQTETKAHHDFVPDKDNPSNKNNTYLDVTLIGHSMGAMVINEIARYCNEQEDCYGSSDDAGPSSETPHIQPDHLSVRTIAFFAAACTVRDFESFTVPFMGRRLHRGEPIDFYNLSLHPQAELRETNAADLVPRGSLLVWIDNYFSNPKTYYDKTFGNFNTAVLSAQIVPPLLRPYTHFKAFKVGNAVLPPLKPQKHGDFLLMPNNDDKLVPYWTDEFWKPSCPQLSKAR